MSNTTLTADIVAKEAVMILENDCVMGKLVHRGFEDEFAKNVNGYTVGETVSIRRPNDFTVRTGATAAVQDVVEGKTSITVDTQIGVDFKFTSQDLTLQIKDLSERVIKPAMVQLANKIDGDLLGLYKKVPNHVTIPAGGIDSYADFALAAERMDLIGVPQDEGRAAVLTASDTWKLLGSQTALYMQDVAKSAYRTRKLGMIGGIDTYTSLNAKTHTTGDRTGTDLVDQALVDGTQTWASYKDATSVTLHMDGFAAATSTVKAGDTFTIADVWDVNPVTKERLGHLKMFVVMEDFTAASSEGDLQIWPPLIMSGAQQTVSVDSGTEVNDNVVTWQGTASTGFPQNLYFHKNAFALVTVPMVKPPGAVDVGRRSYKGYSVRVIPYYDGTNDVSNWRLDLLYGIKAIDPRLAVRASLAADVA
jgi:hypothetical protein